MSWYRRAGAPVSKHPKEEALMGRPLSWWAVRAVAAILVMPSASIAADKIKGSPQIVVGQSIDGVRIGQSEAQVRRLLGKPERAYLPHPGESGTPTYWTYKTYHPPTREVVFFEGRVTGVIVSYLLNPGSKALKRYRTNRAVGLGSSLARVHAAYPHAKCSSTDIFPSTPANPENKIPGCAVKTGHGERGPHPAVVTEFLTGPNSPTEVSQIAVRIFGEVDITF
jgi:hypothetical protein